MPKRTPIHNLQLLLASICLVGAHAATPGLAQDLTSAAGSVPKEEDNAGLKVIVEAAIRELFEKEPQILTEALSHAQAKQAAAQQASAAQALISTAAVIVDDPQVPHIGPAKGRPVVEFFDYNCHFCKDFSEQTFTAVTTLHPELRWDFVFAPVLGGGSVRLAQFAAAAQLQGRFEPVHRYLIARKGTVATEQDADALRDELVRVGGLDKVRFDKALADGSAKALVDHHWGYVTRAAITGTPTFVVGNGIMPGYATAEQFSALVAAAAKAEPLAIRD